LKGLKPSSGDSRCRQQRESPERISVAGRPEILVKSGGQAALAKLHAKEAMSDKQSVAMGARWAC
jgi:hypothetical protein